MSPVNRERDPTKTQIRFSKLDSGTVLAKNPLVKNKNSTNTIKSMIPQKYLFFNPDTDILALCFTFPAPAFNKLKICSQINELNSIV